MFCFTNVATCSLLNDEAVPHGPGTGGVGAGGGNKDGGNYSEKFGSVIFIQFYKKKQKHIVSFRFVSSFFLKINKTKKKAKNNV